MKCYASPYEGQQDYLFFSYCHDDAAKVFPIIERLALEGFRVWFDDGIHPGEEWPEVIANHLTGAKACVSVVSVQAAESHNCRNELSFALANNKPMLSIILEDFPMPLGIQLQLSNTRYLRTYEENEESFYNKLLHAPLLAACREAGSGADSDALQSWREHCGIYSRGGDDSEAPAPGPGPINGYPWFVKRPKKEKKTPPAPPVIEQPPEPEAEVPPAPPVVEQPPEPEVETPPAPPVIEQPPEPEAETPPAPPVVEQPPEPEAETPPAPPVIEQPPEPEVETPPAPPAIEQPPEPEVETPPAPPVVEQPPEPEEEVPPAPPVLEQPPEPEVETPPAPPVVEQPPEPEAEVPPAPPVVEQPPEPEDDEEKTILIPEGDEEEEDGRTIVGTRYNPAMLLRISTGEMFPLKKERTVLGRTRSKADLAFIDNLKISGRHAEIWKKGSEYELRNLKPTNETVVNGQLLEPSGSAELTPCSEILLADEAFFLLYGDAYDRVFDEQKICLLKSRDTGETRVLAEDSLPLDRHHKWAGDVLGDQRIHRSGHAEIYREHGRIYLRDLGSRHGTFLNGRRLTPNEGVELHDNDILAVVDTEFLYYEIKTGA